MKLLVGLGNPGHAYEKARHNIGARVLKEFAAQEKIDLKKSDSLTAVWGKGALFQEEIRLLLPQSYMNLSGPVVARCVQKWDVQPEEMFVVLDDLHLPLGNLRIRPSGSYGGQQGLRSVIEAIGTEQFPRLRIGIESETMNEPWQDFVLKPFTRKEETVITKAVEAAVACCRLWIDQGIEACMNRFNRKGLS